MNLATKFLYFQCRHRKLGRLSAKLMRVIFSCDITFLKKIGDNNSLEHNGLGIVLSREVTIGSNCRIYQHVTIGAGRGGYPTIGNNVTIYPNCTICGKIVIGDDVIIGANSFVNQDIPANCVYGGVPARLIKYRKQ